MTTDAQPSAYIAGIIQGDGEDLHGARIGDLLLVMKDTPANRALQAELLRDGGKVSVGKMPDPTKCVSCDNKPTKKWMDIPICDECWEKPPSDQFLAAIAE